MPEVINVSLSQRANHLATHLYNAQDSYLDYVNGAAKSKVDPNVFFNPTPAWDNKSVTFHPRAMLFDLSGGFGSLGQYEYYQAMQAEADGAPPAVEVIRQARIPKSAYLEALDKGETAPPLHSGNTTYWSDYARTIYEPKSFNCIDNWEYHPTDHPTGRLRAGASKTFLDYRVGVEEWTERERRVHCMDETFRAFLERSDQIEGINVMTEVDTAWGGVSGELLEAIRDEYCAKTSIFTWGLHSPAPTLGWTAPAILSRIRTHLALMATSSLYIPLANPLATTVDPTRILPLVTTSLWSTTAVQMLPIDAVAVLQAQRQDRVSMAEVEVGLTMGTKRNIVAATKARASDWDYNLSAAPFKPLPAAKAHVFSKTVVVRNGHDPDGFEDRYEAALESFGNFLRLLEEGTEVKGLVHHRSMIPAGMPDSYPQNLLGEGMTCTSMAVTAATRDSLLGMKTFVSRMLRGDDREALIDDLENHAVEYEYGWMDDSESGDDE